MATLSAYVAPDTNFGSADPPAWFAGGRGRSQAAGDLTEMMYDDDARCEIVEYAEFIAEEARHGERGVSTSLPLMFVRRESGTAVWRTCRV
jgi:hypothetical protein